MKEKFTTTDLRDSIDDELLATLFKKILDAERHAQNQQCYYSPCGIVPESSDPWKSDPENNENDNENNENSESSSSILWIDNSLLFFSILLSAIQGRR